MKISHALALSAGVFACSGVEAQIAIEEPDTQDSAAANPANGPAAVATADAADTSSASPENTAAQGAIDTIPVSVEAAPDVPIEEAPAMRGNRLIEEVVVTAQKREENVQDVPISIQAFSAEALDAKGITNAVDLQQATPGLSYTVLNSFSIIYLRGVGTDAFLPSADLSIATYIDGIYFPSSAGLASEFGAVERVEVLKGPQGTLFGRNSTGGAISTTTKKPSQTPESSVQVSYGRYNDLRTNAYTNVPVTDELAFNISALYNHKTPYYEHLTLGDALQSDVDKGARAKVRWTPGEQFDITLAGLITKSDGSSASLDTQIDPKPAFRALFGPPLPDYQANNDAPSDYRFDNKVAYLDAKYSPGILDVRLLASTQKITTLAYNDFDATSLPLVSFDTRGAYADVQTAELQLISNDSTWGADWLKFVGGLYYFQSDAGFDPAVLAVGFYDAAALPVVGPLLGGRIQGLLDLADPLLITPVDPINVAVTGLLKTRSTAGFFQGTASITDTLSLTLGGRYQTETRNLYRSTVGVVGLPNPLIRYPQQSADTTNFSPKISLEFRPDIDTMVYASWVKGFKSGTYNIVSIYTAPDYVKPEEIVTTELGIKSEWFDRSLRFNAAIFNNEIRDLQVQIISLASGGAVAFDNANKARSRGAEFDTVWQPLPKNLPGLAVTANATYLDAKYTDFKNGSGYNDAGLYFGKGSLLLLPNQDFTGNRIVQSAKFSGDFGVSYVFDIKGGPVELASDVYYNSGLYFTAQNSPHSQEGNYYLLNARLSYLYEPWNLRMTAFAKNINNGRYYLFNYETDFGTNALLQTPATYGLRLAWEFGH
ncbi:TonB-dependent receptor [Hydrocarboniphaga sp.]|uniref:TonB-dependent receptor n=1 Tax=Hydrocarboniphaga sp. TaxID=2033016 RepID=UPI00260239D1|nr:TonB-dependent receptor [Hydrocarboniphaga sp.]